MLQAYYVEGRYRLLSNAIVFFGLAQYGRDLITELQELRVLALFIKRVRGLLTALVLTARTRTSG